MMNIPGATTPKSDFRVISTYYEGGLMRRGQLPYVESARQKFRNETSTVRTPRIFGWEFIFQFLEVPVLPRTYLSTTIFFFLL